MNTTAPPLRNDRQEAILQAAERLFADHGFHAVTLRQIAEAADVPLALVGYYFGRKHDLFRAIFVHHRHWHLDRAAALDDARRQARHPQGLHRIVEAFVLPLLHLRQQPDTAAYARLLARELLLGSSEAGHPLLDGFEPLVQRFMDALHAALPGAGHAELAWACQFTLGAIGLHLRDERITRLSQGRVRAHDPAGAPHLVRYIVAGLRAALSDPKTPGQRLSG
ncbi:MAG: TetR/AcrR family transcriptional regulator [Hydrogenophaga sp.]|nr:TetR/AcrR family transcriptional regulator [Hydrogenophaga sp.]